uniref:Uncharacterized protein n=1 Tax=Arundo donax TaxID=35708 RepID=A0A0A8YLE8_ARUDO
MPFPCSSCRIRRERSCLWASTCGYALPLLV